jgi:hypothetical protein
MQQLSKAIASANKTAYDLANAMEKTVPQRVRQNQHLARVVDVFSQEARDRIDAVDRRVTELRAAEPAKSCCLTRRVIQPHTRSPSGSGVFRLLAAAPGA